MKRVAAHALSILAGIAVAIPGVAQQSPQIAADAYIQSGIAASTNFGAIPNVLVGPGGAAPTQNVGLLKFELSGLGDVQSTDVRKAVLWVWVNRIITPGAIDVAN